MYAGQIYYSARNAITGEISDDFYSTKAGVDGWIKRQPDPHRWSVVRVLVAEVRG